MIIEIELPISSPSEEICPFTLWLPREEAHTPEYKRAMAAAEQIMTGMSPLGLETPAPVAGSSFLGQW